MNRFMKLMGFVLMSEAVGDGAGGPAAAPAPAAAEPAAPATGATETTVLTPTAPATAPAAGATETKTPEQIQQEADAAAATKKEADAAKPTGAPEAYTDFTLPEGMDMDVGTLDAFKGLAKELNIPQEAAQKLIDLQTTLVAKQADAYQQAVVAQGQKWAAEVKSDPELGGENYDKSVASAIKVIQSFGDPALTELLNDSGLGNHPALFKFCHRISAAISEDKFVMPGSQSNAPKEMSIVEAFS
ncbi:peptidase [Pseudomonas lundensis]|uniref:peptidase n=1 Tax=Pseudomonas lundensis TaxID=86185 RepID=UPI0014736DA8|nr:peptidase [Pseudomonas lundensis]NNA40033.1 peptidase [Pseudomonas lundensis]